MPIEKAIYPSDNSHHHPGKAPAQLPQQRRPAVAVVGFKGANVRTPVAVLVLVLCYVYLQTHIIRRVEADFSQDAGG